MSIGLNIKMLREQKHMTQLDVAKHVVCSVPAVSTWEQGHKIPRMRTIEALAKLFGVSKSVLIDGDEETITRLSLSNDELHLVDSFRSLTDYNRSLVLGMVDAALKSQSSLEK
jgi:transcriptional regulator with XRE-family HTH domain